MTEKRLLEPQELAELGPPEAVRLPLDLIDANPHNPRTVLIEVDALADNIERFTTSKQLGLMQPVIVRRAGDRFELINGHRRRAAFVRLAERHPEDPRWRAIPAVVWTADDDTTFLAQISANTHSRAWRPREEAAMLERLVVGGRNLRQIGEVLNRDESWASKRLRVYADSVLSGYVQTGQITASVAEELLIVADVDTKRALAERAAAEHWTQDRVRGEVRALRLDKQLRDIARRARELLTLLSSIDPSRLPDDAAIDLNLLRRRIVALSRVPVIPSIASAEQAAGVKTQEPKLTRRKRRTRPRPAGYVSGVKGPI